MIKTQFVTFKIHDHLFGIDVLMVREVNQVLALTPVQHAPHYVRGLVNLRGQAVTVIDLGIRLGLGAREIQEESHNIVLKVDSVGLLVDAIGEVVETPIDCIEPPPANLGDIQEDLVGAVAQMEEALLFILSVEKILEYDPSQAINSLDALSQKEITAASTWEQQKDATPFTLNK